MFNQDASSFQLRFVVILFLLVLASASYLSSQVFDVQINSAALYFFRPLPAVVDSPDNPVTDAKVKLGRMLYYEPRLSASQDISCNTCHPLDAYGAESEAVSTGHGQQKGTRNAPTVYNAAGHFVQFWDGRAPNVEEQAKGPVLNPVEMALPSDAAAVRVLSSMPEYVALFREAFPKEKDPVTFNNMALAIGAFERGLITPSRWDLFLSGANSALSPDEKAGFNKFVEAGCHTCHNGAYVGGNSFQRLGIFKPWPNQVDPGRQKITKQEADRLVFKVPSLRNVTKTAPYFHDGSIPTLDQAIRQMAVHQRGSQLSDADVKSIVTWLDTLTGQIPHDYIKPPVLPKSTPATPRPAGG
jgi:cytochrome c peroxidase